MAFSIELLRGGQRVGRPQRRGLPNRLATNSMAALLRPRAPVIKSHAIIAGCSPTADLTCAIALDGSAVRTVRSGVPARRAALRSPRNSSVV